LESLRYNLDDLMQTTRTERGVINVLSAEKLFRSPKIYATFLLWLIAELFENLPEVGDVPEPKLVFFFDEAHLLFDEAPRALLERIRTGRALIRSRKEWGSSSSHRIRWIFPILAWASLAIVCSMRFALSLAGPKAVRAAAETFRQNRNSMSKRRSLNSPSARLLVSFLDETGTARCVDRALILPRVRSFHDRGR
jgi:hypothetical protein